ncbi:VOC family protein [Glacieibacterium sp.]|uniref:VOC family protein n=1 Tax=Glacieibacterium sp. TaxID=2860237 RepID=UPI003AFF8C8C
MAVHHAIIPALQYDDAPAAIDFLVDVFGFTRQAVYPDDSGGIAHAQLLLDGNMVMVSTLRAGNIYGIDSPARLGGITGTISVTLDDPDAHHDRAVAAGADIIRGIADMDYGGRSYDVRDPGGHVWTFGSYDPWA